MMRKLCYFVVSMALTSALHAQAPLPTGPRDHDVYCAGIVTMTPPPQDNYVISGVESATKILFNQGDLVFINGGSKQGVQVGAEFLVSRAIKDHSKAEWFVWQKGLMRAMGQTWADIGRLRVVHVEQDTSTAQIVSFCDQMYRGDTVVPFAARQVPTYKPAAKLDISPRLLAKKWR